MQKQDYDIIIAGAGPTGLMLANQLCRFGIDFLLLDKKKGPTTESRALVVQARSMEIYEQMRLSDEVIRSGQPSGGISIYKKGKRAASVFLSTMGEKISPFPYVMIYEQSKNESLLYKNLQTSGREVQWDSEITGMEEKEDGYIVHIKEAGKIDHSYSCKYLVACDGGKSILRDLSGMAFTGGTYENVFYVADTHVKGPNLSSEMLSLFFTREAITMMFPMPGHGRFRMLGILPKEYYHRNELQFEELISHVKENMQLPVEFYDTQWYSTYRLHHKKAAHFNKGNIFFAGDAAHVHSPAGGQGMNTGLQDAYNLAWKLALVSTGKAARALLDTYHEERYPIAVRLLKTTDRVFTVMTKSNRFFGFIKLFVVPRILPQFNRFKKLRRLWFGEVSQTKIHYRSSPLSLGKAGSIQAGIRFPYFQVLHHQQLVSVFQLLRDHHTKTFLVLLYNLPGKDLFKINQELFNLLSLEVSVPNNDTLKEAGFPASFMVLLRPDNYIGYISERIDTDELNGFMKSCYHLSKA